MSVTSVKELANRDGNRQTQQGSITRKYIVRCSSHTDSAATVLNSGSLPALYAVHPDDASYVVKERSAAQDGNSKTVWIATIKYELIGKEQEDSPPSERPARIQYRTVKEYKPVQKDVNDDPIGNQPFLQQFDPLPEKYQSYREITIERNELDYDDVATSAYIDTTNKYRFMGWSADECLMSSIDADLEFDADEGYYYKVTYSILCKAGGWKDKRYNVSYKYLETAGDDHKDAKVSTGKDGLSDPIPIAIKEDGTKVADGDPPVELEFQLYESLNWRPLGLE